MRIGEIAVQAGVPTATVRYYERRGLVPRAPRTASGYRAYGPDVVRRLRFIKHAQELGFALEDIQHMLALRATTRPPALGWPRRRARRFARCASGWLSSDDSSTRSSVWSRPASDTRWRSPAPSWP
jgi:DNA-binding transcriptional MerR regulator